MKRIAILGVLFLVVAIPAFSAETAPSVSAADVQEVLNRVGTSGNLHGAGAAEMSAFMDMVQTPEVAKLAEKLSRQLEAQGGGENMSMEEISAFVRDNITQRDVEQLLGTAVSSKDFQRGLQEGGRAENLDALLQALQTK